MTIAARRLPFLAAALIVGLVSTEAAGSAQSPPAGVTQGLPSKPGIPGTATASPRGPGQPARDPSAKPASSTGAVRGVVIAAETGRPLRRARVTLLGAGVPQPRVTLSDTEGAFAFEELPAGRYELSASKTRYVDTRLGSRRTGGPGRPFELADGQAMDGVRLQLPIAGVIAGQVFDELGEPVGNVTVSPLRYRTLDGVRRLIPTGMPRLTDDAGTFRLFGLPPGRYFVIVRPEDVARFGNVTMPTGLNGFAPTYYPSTADAEAAQSIEVTAGTEVAADISLVPTRLATVSGIVVDAAGAPATAGYLRAISTGGGQQLGGPAASTQIQTKGTFTLVGLPPSTYRLEAQPFFGVADEVNGSASPRTRRTVSATVVVAGEAINDLRLVAATPLRIPIGLTFEDDAAEKPDRLYLFASTDGMGGGSAEREADGRWWLVVGPGAYRLSASTMLPWRVKRISYRGHDLESNDLVELTSGPTEGRIEVTFTTRSAAAAGTVTDDARKPVIDYVVVLFPAEAEVVRRTGSARLRTARADQQGRFRFDRMPPGDYVAVALQDVERDDLFDPDLLEQLQRVATAVTLRESETAPLSLTLATLP